MNDNDGRRGGYHHSSVGDDLAPGSDPLADLVMVRGNSARRETELGQHRFHRGHPRAGVPQ